MREHFNIDKEEVIEFIINNRIYPDSLKRLYNENIFQANEIRKKFKEKLDKEFSKEVFYAPIRHPLRNQTLFYEIAYGHESKLAGTGLFERHFQSAFLHPYFEAVVKYLKRSWNFQSENNFKLFYSNILPKLKIPGYKEVLPIRLASYFYPEVIFPIFKIHYLEEICNSFGFKTNEKTKEGTLYCCNSYLKNRMIVLDDDNTIKMYISTQVHYTIELLNRINNNECYQEILDKCESDWIKLFYQEGRKVLKLNNSR